MFDKSERFAAKPSRSSKPGSKPGNRGSRFKNKPNGFKSDYKKDNIDDNRERRRDRAERGKPHFDKEGGFRKEEGTAFPKRKKAFDESFGRKERSRKSFEGGRKPRFDKGEEKNAFSKKESGFKEGFARSKRSFDRESADKKSADFRESKNRRFGVNKPSRREEEREGTFKERGSQRKGRAASFKHGDSKRKEENSFERKEKQAKRGFSKRAVSKANAIKRDTIPNLNKSKKKAVSGKFIEELGLKRIFSEICSHHKAELYDVELLQEDSEYILRVIIEGSEEVSLELCANISLEISDWIDEYEAENGDMISIPYNLEVSSGGDLRHLKTEKDFLKFLNKPVNIETFSKMDDENNKGRRRFSGTVSSVHNGVVTIHVTLENVDFDIEISDIKKANPDFEIE